MTRSSTLLLLLLAPLSASAFTVLPSQSSTSTTAIFMSDSVDTSRLVLTGNNIDLTDSLKEHADKRIGGLLDKLGSGGLVKECEIHLSVSKNPSVRTQLPEIKYYRVVYNRACNTVFLRSSDRHWSYLDFVAWHKKTIIIIRR
mmetsp:Transcript_12808/g.25646  ORF Transcript_12808/g.25646 Transcript_12808/m.25646 type:complete len:143 (-) Transcript_12808:64-492(-)